LSKIKPAKTFIKVRMFVKHRHNVCHARKQNTRKY